MHNCQWLGNTVTFGSRPIDQLKNVKYAFVTDPMGLIRWCAPRHLAAGEAPLSGHCQYRRLAATPQQAARSESRLGGSAFGRRRLSVATWSVSAIWAAVPRHATWHEVPTTLNASGVSRPSGPFVGTRLRKHFAGQEFKAVPSSRRMPVAHGVQGRAVHPCAGLVLKESPDGDNRAQCRFS